MSEHIDALVEHLIRQKGGIDDACLSMETVQHIDWVRSELAAVTTERDALERKLNILTAALEQTITQLQLIACITDEDGVEETAVESADRAYAAIDAANGGQRE